MSAVNSDPQLEEKEESIDIRVSDIVEFFVSSRVTTIRWTILFVLIGIIYAFLQPNQYTSEAKVMPEIQNRAGNNLGSIGSLAGLAGISLDGLSSNTETIRPDLYPTILKSIPFGLYMLRKTVVVENEKKPISLENYNLWASRKVMNGIFTSWVDTGHVTQHTSAEKFSTYGSIRLTEQQEIVINDITTRINGEIDKKSGVLTISARMLHPEVAAQAANYALKYLTNYVTNYRTGKARQQVRFLQNQVAQAQMRYKTAEYALSNYRDNNRSLFLNTAKLDEQRLQADFLLTQSLYNELSKQLEQAKIKVQEDIPVFQILEPARVPLTKSAPKRAIIIIGFAIMGFLVGIIVFSVRRFFLPFNRSYLL